MLMAMECLMGRKSPKEVTLEFGKLVKGDANPQLHEIRVDNIK